MHIKNIFKSEMGTRFTNVRTPQENITRFFVKEYLPYIIKTIVVLKHGDHFFRIFLVFKDFKSSESREASEPC